MGFGTRWHCWSQKATKATWFQPKWPLAISNRSHMAVGHLRRRPMQRKCWTIWRWIQWWIGENVCENERIVYRSGGGGCVVCRKFLCVDPPLLLSPLRITKSKLIWFCQNWYSNIYSWFPNSFENSFRPYLWLLLPNCSNLFSGVKFTRSLRLWNLQNT